MPHEGRERRGAQTHHFCSANTEDVFAGEQDFIRPIAERHLFRFDRDVSIFQVDC